MDKHARMGNNLRGLLNDLKRRPEDAASELCITKEDMLDMLNGKRAIPKEIIDKATQIWPLNERDFFLIDDDAPNGVRIMRAEESARTSRIMEKANKLYYEYRDTVMSRVASFRPEWIAELCVVDDNDPENPAIQWNNGHFMHQFTYFVGPVNFYYHDSDGRKHVAVLDTGDTMYITPFVPHTFATRRNIAGKKGLILALTYGAKLAGDAQHELSAIGYELAKGFALDFSTKEKAVGALLNFHRVGNSITIEELAKRTGKRPEEVRRYEAGEALPDYDTIMKLAAALNVNARDILPTDGIGEKVIVKKYRDARRWLYPTGTNSYEIIELAGTQNLPHSKAIELNIKKQSCPDMDLRVGLHQYGFNIGQTPTTMYWQMSDQQYKATINPGDSIYVKPYTSHCFRGEGKLLLLRIGGRVAGEPQRELSSLGRESINRVLGETIQWFSPKNKQVE